MLVQVKKIQEIDKTGLDAIASYGSFVDLFNKTQARVKANKRKDWTNDRVLLSRLIQQLPTIHYAISKKFGTECLSLAIESHPFD